MKGVALSEVAVVLAAHGDRGGESPNATLLSHAASLGMRGCFRSVSAGALRSDCLPLDKALLQARASGASHIAVYPLFMADGYFTGTVLPQQIAKAGLSGTCTLLPPLGLDPQIPALMTAHALAAARKASLSPPHTRLLIASHGSQKSRASLRSTERVACKVRQQGQFLSVETAYLEEDPSLDSKLIDCPATTLVLGFFSGDGLHAAEDVPGAIARSGADAQHVGSLGRLPQIAEIIEAAVRLAAAPPSVG